MILRFYEEDLLAMSFEQMLGLLTSLPQKFLIQSCEKLKKEFDEAQGEQKPEQIKVASLEFQVVSSEEKPNL